MLIVFTLLCWCYGHVPYQASRNHNFRIKNTATPIANIQYQFFKQQRDHFNPSDSNTWQQAYYEYNTYYQNGGPVFLSISGESQMNSSYIGYGLEAILAKKYNGLVINLEHRYYDIMNQFPQDYPADFAWLTTSQALQDIASFIKFRQTSLPADTIWVAMGGSYPGNLAAWARLKFPDLIYAAHSSSAPVLSTTDFYQYGVAVEAGIQYSGGSPTCATNWQRAVKLYDKYMVQQSYSDDQKFKYSSYSTLLSSAVQYGRDITSPPKMGMICGGLMFPAFVDSAASDDTLLAEYKKVISNFSADASSSPIAKLIDASSTGDAQRNNIAWIFQSCYEFGYLQDYTSQESTAYSQFRTIDGFLNNVCQSIFGVKPSSDLVNNAYMGLNITSAITRVVYVHGTVDPWHTIGISDVGSTDNVFIKNEMGHHCDDMSGSFGVSPTILTQILTAWDVYLGNNPKNTFTGTNTNYNVNFVGLPPIPSGSRIGGGYAIDTKKLGSLIALVVIIAAAVAGFTCYRRRKRNQIGSKLALAQGHVVAPPAQAYYQPPQYANQPVYPQQYPSNQPAPYVNSQSSVPSFPQSSTGYPGQAYQPNAQTGYPAQPYQQPATNYLSPTYPQVYPQ
ncbi:hypothetical protein HDV01_004407 [Terramyces sp. JEL0728]|nr:hypothetical protein HDV01_004407 [Terramyces sp. JEL0728]